MRLLFIILTVFCNIYIAYAQTITGQVMDEGQNPVGYANVVLINSTDSFFCCRLHNK